MLHRHIHAIQLLNGRFQSTFTEIKRTAKPGGEMTPQPYSLPYSIFQCRHIEIDIGQSHEKGTNRELIKFRLHNALCSGLEGRSGKQAQGIDQPVLNIRYVRGLAAYPGDGTACTPGGLFTLIAKHGDS